MSQTGLALLTLLALAAYAPLQPARAALEININSVIEAALAVAKEDIAKGLQGPPAPSARQDSTTPSPPAPFLGDIMGNSTCGMLDQWQGTSCSTPRAPCCAVSQTMSTCKGYLQGNATVSPLPAAPAPAAVMGTCCVVLVDAQTKQRPFQFCTALWRRGINLHLPASNLVRLTPICPTAEGAGRRGSLKCEVVLRDIPDAFALPPKSSKPVFYKFKTSTPCLGPFTNFSQTVQGNTITSLCQ